MADNLAYIVARERERGMMENLLSMPTRPFEVLLGKIIPYVLVGYIHVVVILVAAHFLFHVPMVGNLGLLFAVELVARGHMVPIIERNESTEPYAHWTITTMTPETRERAKKNAQVFLAAAGRGDDGVEAQRRRLARLLF